MPDSHHSIYTCTACGNMDHWSPDWSWYGPLEPTTKSAPPVFACSDECRRLLIRDGRATEESQ